MGGEEAVQEIHTIDPAAKVIVSSGYSNDPIMANYQDYGFVAALVKPFQLQDLRATVRRVL
jgi:DNA-binding NtrC family response regulator